MESARSSSAEGVAPAGADAPLPSTALLPAIVLLAATSVYTLLAVAIFLSAQRAPYWEAWLATVPATTLAGSVALAALVLRHRQRDTTRISRTD